MKIGGKKTFFLSSLAFLLAFIIITAVVLLDAEFTEDEGKETGMQSTGSVIIAPGSGASSGDISVNRPYEGQTFTVLCEYSGGRQYGDLLSEGGSLLSEIAYERNLRLCNTYGVSMRFIYSTDVYAEHTASLSGNGGALADIFNINLKKYGQSFLMKGGAYDLHYSSIDLSHEAYSSDFIEYFTIGGKTPFLFGEADPSRYGARYVLNVKSGTAAESALNALAFCGNFTLESVMVSLKDSESFLSLDGSSLHALIMREPLFSFEEGEPKIGLAAYLDGYGRLSAFSSQVTSGGGEAFLSAIEDTPDGYTAYPLPSLSGEDSLAYDMSRVCLFLIPSNIAQADLERVFTLTDSLYKESVGIYSSFYGSPGFFASSGESFCLYPLFGWGDFDEHAYSSLLSGKDSESLASLLSAPEKVSLQALRILLERYADRGA